jgi:hypothetical protein
MACDRSIQIHAPSNLLPAGIAPHAAFCTMSRPYPYRRSTKGAVARVAGPAPGPRSRRKVRPPDFLAGAAERKSRGLAAVRCRSNGGRQTLPDGCCSRLRDRAPRRPAQQQPGFLHPQHGGGPGDGHNRTEHADHPARLGRCYFAPRGRHRCHEHHAGQRNRALARDRHSDGDRGQNPRYPSAVPDRGDCGVGAGRGHRGGGRTGHGRADRQPGDAGRLHPCTGRNRIYMCCGDRACLRLCTGYEGRASRPVVALASE